MRPGYPDEVVRWLASPDARTVVDVGAGTGKFTRQLSAQGRQLIAVEPSERMLGQLRHALPEVDARLGAAESLPVPDGTADVVTFAQSWHWAEHAAASREAARILRPGGILGLTWNLRDERVEWVRELGRAMKADGDGFTEETGPPDVREPFAEPEQLQVGWVSALTRAQLLDLVRSRSYIIVMAPEERDATLAAVDRLLQTHPDLAGVTEYWLPYVTVAYRYRAPGGGARID